MSDIMELIRDYGASWYDRNHAQNYKAYDKIKTRIQAMQEVCDAAVEHCNLPKCNCPLCTAIRKYKAIKE